MQINRLINIIEFMSTLTRDESREGCKQPPPRVKFNL